MSEPSTLPAPASASEQSLRAALQRAQQALRAERALSRAFLDSLPVLFVLVDQSGNFLRWNNRVEQVLHYSPAELTSITALDTIVEEGRELMRDKLAEAASSGISLLETALLTKEGASIPYCLTSAPVVVEGKACIVGVGIDISQRKAAEQQLRESEARYRLLFERSLAGIFRYQMDKGVVDCNESAVRILGYASPQEFVGRNATDIFARVEDFELANKILAEKGELTNFEVQLRHKSNASVWALENVTVTERRDGQPYVLEGSCVDISERKRAEAALRISEQRIALKNRIANICLTLPDDQMYAEVLNVVLEALSSSQGVFGYIDEDGILVVPSLTRDAWERCAVPNKSLRFPRAAWGGIWGRSLVERKSFCCNQPGKVPAGHVPITRCLSVPLLHHDALVGLLLVANKALDYAPSDLELLHRIADFLAPVLHARLQRDAQERARRRAEAELTQAKEAAEAANRAKSEFLANM